MESSLPLVSFFLKKYDRSCRLLKKKNILHHRLTNNKPRQAGVTTEKQKEKQHQMNKRRKTRQACCRNLPENRNEVTPSLLISISNRLECTKQAALDNR
jgi:hypothetical protein